MRFLTLYAVIFRTIARLPFCRGIPEARKRVLKMAHFFGLTNGPHSFTDIADLGFASLVTAGEYITHDAGFWIKRHISLLSTVSRLGPTRLYFRQVNRPATAHIGYLGKSCPQISRFQAFFIQKKRV